MGALRRWEQGMRCNLNGTFCGQTRTHGRGPRAGRACFSTGDRAALTCPALSNRDARGALPPPPRAAHLEYVPPDARDAPLVRILRKLPPLSPPKNFNPIPHPAPRRTPCHRTPL